jgi:hypothetical protein
MVVQPSQRTISSVTVAPGSLLGPFLASRLLFATATAAVAAALHTALPISLWDRWDSVWYQLVAAHGYFVIPGAKRSDLAFYPLFPLLIHLVHALTGIDQLLAGLAIANIAFALALLYLARLAVLEGAPVRVLWLIALFPTAFFFAAAYAESISLFAAAAALYYARCDQLWRASLFAAIGVFAHPTGLILILPIAYAAWRTRGRLMALATLVPPSITQAAIWLYLASIGGPAVLLRVQQGWHRQLSWPWVGFVFSVERLFHERPLWVAEDAGQLATVILFLLISIIASRQLAPLYRLYLGSFWFFVLVTPAIRDHFYVPFLSADRFVLELFPLAFWAVKVLNDRQFRTLVLASSVILSGCTAMFLAGGWVG